MKLTVRAEGSGLHPSEVAVVIDTVDGPQRLIVSQRSLDHNFLNVGVIRESDDRYLVELPRETQSGAWRVWVEKTLVNQSHKVPA